MNTEFHLPVLFDLCATFAFALTGALAGIKRGYDIVGVFFIALVSGLGGGLIRDGIFIPKAEITPLLQDPRYIELVAGATIAGAVAGKRMHHFARVIAILDALGLGAYAMFGTQKALHAGLDAPAAVLVGVINAAGGGLLRDIITREEPLVFKPGQFYVLTAVFGSVAFVFFVVTMGWTAANAGLIAVGVTLLCRISAIAFNWQTRSVKELSDVFP